MEATATKPPEAASLPGTPLSRRPLPAWAPLRSPWFRALWIASIASNIGTWMHDPGATWLMSSLTTSPKLNALVQTAGAFPMFLLALPAGALADVLDRRKLMILTQSWAAIVATVLGILTVMHMTGVVTLLVATLLLSIGNGMSAPAWQSIVPEIVKRHHLQSAMSLNGISFNLSRILGPAIGGLLIGLFASPERLGNLGAPGVVFLVNGISFLGVVTVLAAWDRPARTTDMPAEHILGAVKTGLRFTWHSPVLRAIFTRLCAFILCGSALWSMITLHARKNLHLDATQTGLLMASFGAGAVLTGVTYPSLRRRFSSHALVGYGLCGAALNLLCLSYFQDKWLVWLAMAVAGFSWSLTMLTYNVVVIRSVPDWVRSRCASMFLFVFMGGSFFGSLFWGALASQLDAAHFAGILISFRLAAAGLIMGLIGLQHLRIVDPGNDSLAPSMHWPEPVVAFEPCPEEGPVLVTVEYQVDPENAGAFIAAMQPIRRNRLRDGALRWNLFQDAAYPGRWVETILMESWNDYLRQHARVTNVDRQLEVAAKAFHVGVEPPTVSHLIAASALCQPNDSEDE